jgi:hypothetical protein
MLISRRRMVRAPRTVLLGKPISWVQRCRLCASAPSTVQAVGVELAGGEVRQRLFLQVNDHLLNDSMVTML